jgi:hypothetical protein
VTSGSNRRHRFHPAPKVILNEPETSQHSNLENLVPALAQTIGEGIRESYAKW